MTWKARELLLQLSQHPSAEDSVQWDYSKDSTEKSMEIRAFDELIKRGYILKKGSAIGFIIVSITSAGKYAAEQL